MKKFSVGSYGDKLPGNPEGFIEKFLQKMFDKIFGGFSETFPGEISVDNFFLKNIVGMPAETHR